MLLHKECLPTQLGQPAEQVVIAATFKDCNGDPLTPDAQLAKCSDIPAAAAPQQLSIAGNVVSLTNGGSVTLPAGTDAQTLSISGQTLTIAGGNSVTLPAGAAQVPQVLSLYNDVLTLSNGGGSVTLVDNDSQTLDLQGNTLSISNGNSVTLPVYERLTEYRYDDGCEPMAPLAVGATMLARSNTPIVNTTSLDGVHNISIEYRDIQVLYTAPTVADFRVEISADNGATWGGIMEVHVHEPGPSLPIITPLPLSTVSRNTPLLAGANTGTVLTRLKLLSSNVGALSVGGCSVLSQSVVV
jgi:hypothetical protein